MKVITAITVILFPAFLKSYILKLLGHKVHSKARIGFCFIWTKHLQLGKGTRIKSFNLIYNAVIKMEDHSIIKRFNIINGPVLIHMKPKSSIGKLNKISRGKKGVSYGEASLTLEESAIITANHYIDVTRSVRLGAFSILAGIRSQLWTHGYVHAPEGPGRFRVDGEIHIGSNVYIGSGVIINPGVYINDTINVGGGAVVSKSLNEKGMYVAQALRHLDKGYDDIKSKLRKVDEDGLLDEVYEK